MTYLISKLEVIDTDTQVEFTCREGDQMISCAVYLDETTVKNKSEEELLDLAYTQLINLPSFLKWKNKQDRMKSFVGMQYIPKEVTSVNPSNIPIDAFQPTTTP